MTPAEGAGTAPDGRAQPGGQAAPAVRTLLARAADDLGAGGVTTPGVDAELLLAHAWGVTRGELATRVVLATPVPADVVDAFGALVARRAAREPLQHLTGTTPFRHLELAVGPGVFVPRPETEDVAQVAIDEARRVVAAGAAAPVVVDLCTGSGAIALALATEVPQAQVHAVELDADAHAWADRNVRAVSRDGKAAGAAGASAAPLVTLVRGDARTALGHLDGACDVVVSNPPYVPPGAVPVDPEVALHDPDVALYGLGPDGLEVPRGITAAAARLLRDGGLYVMEHAEVQAEAARRMLEDTGCFQDVRTRDDLTGRPRMVVGRRTPRGVGGSRA